MKRNIKQFFKTWTRGDKWGVAFMCFMVLVIFLCRFISLPTSFSQVKISPMVVEAKEPIFCRDSIACVRDVGELIGYSNWDIREMIRIAQCESKFDPTAKNPNSTATGIFQILTGTWAGNKCTGDITNFKDNVWCGWKLRQASGTGPWVSSSACWRTE